MNIEIKTLCENTASIGCIGEWGLSVLISVDGKEILFDTGAGNTIIHNSKDMEVDLRGINKIVLSHGHYDHTGGLLSVLRETNGADIFAHPDIWDKKYALHDGKEFNVGMPFAEEELIRAGARFNLSREPQIVAENVFTTGEIPLITEFEAVEKDLFVREDDKLKQDPLADDLSLIIKTTKGLVIILGCAHRGVINTILHAQKLARSTRVHAVIGGMHLFRADEPQKDKTIAALKGMNINMIGLSHCTGFEAACRVSREFEGAFFLNNAGTKKVILQ